MNASVAISGISPMANISPQRRSPGRGAQSGGIRQRGEGRGGKTGESLLDAAAAATPVPC